MQTVRPALIGAMILALILIAKHSDAESLGERTLLSSSVSADKEKSSAEREAADNPPRPERLTDVERKARAEEQQAEMKRQALARELSCVIKPAMSDDEINHCKWAWGAARP